MAHNTESGGQGGAARGRHSAKCRLVVCLVARRSGRQHTHLGVQARGSCRARAVVPSLAVRVGTAVLADGRPIGVSVHIIVLHASRGAQRGRQQGAPIGRGPPTPLGDTHARVIDPRAAPRTQASSLSRGSTLKGSPMTRGALTTGKKSLAGLLLTTTRASGAAGAAGAGSGAPLALRFRV